MARVPNPGLSPPRLPSGTIPARFGDRPGRPAYQPRATHSARWGRSAPMVVSTPWPGSTMRVVGNVNRRSSIERMIVSKSASGNEVLPGPPGNRVSPREQQRRALDVERHRAGGVAGVVDRVQSQVPDLDDLGVVDEHVVADVGQLGGVEAGDRPPRSRPRGSPARPGCGPSGRGSRAPGAHRGRGTARAAARARWRRRSARRRRCAGSARRTRCCRRARRPPGGPRRRRCSSAACSRSSPYPPGIMGGHDGRHHGAMTTGIMGP